MKKKLKPRGPWQAVGMQRARIPKNDSKMLRIRAEELKGKADAISRQADELIRKAEIIETARQREEETNGSA
jgi:hypothetical protein